MATKPKQATTTETVSTSEDDWEDIERPCCGLATEGDTIRGYYLGSREVLVTDEKGKPKPRTLHRLRLSAAAASVDGKTVQPGSECELWGAAIMDRLLSEATFGRETMVTRLDKVKRSIRYAVRQRGAAQPGGVIGHTKIGPVTDAPFDDDGGEDLDV